MTDVKIISQNFVTSGEILGEDFIGHPLGSSRSRRRRRRQSIVERSQK